jgi:hypothetical protein
LDLQSFGAVVALLDALEQSLQIDVGRLDRQAGEGHP